MIVKCPHCSRFIEVLELNCSIFRCGVYIDTYEQLPPHSPKEVCELAVKNNLIFGCGKPFQIFKGVVIKCEYI